MFHAKIYIRRSDKINVVKRMLSKIELKYLKFPERFDADYQRILRHRIRVKVQRLRIMLPLLEAHGFRVMGDCNSVTDFYNGQQGLNQPSFYERLEPRAGFEPATSALPRRCPNQLGHRGTNQGQPKYYNPTRL